MGCPDKPGSRCRAVTEFLKGKQFDGQDLYGILDVYTPWGGFGWYFFASRATGLCQTSRTTKHGCSIRQHETLVNNPASSVPPRTC